VGFETIRDWTEYTLTVSNQDDIHDVRLILFAKAIAASLPFRLGTVSRTYQYLEFHFYVNLTLVKPANQGKVKAWDRCSTYYLYTLL